MPNPRVKTNIPATGAVGVAPPADAPVESAQPLQPDALSVMQERAAQNAAELKPFAPPQHTKTPEQINAELRAMGLPEVEIAAPTPDPTATLAAEFFGTDAPPPPSEDAFNGELPPLSAEDRARMPAASDTESPSRGILPNLTPPKGDKFEGISRGGFSDLGEAQYFPLDGNELKELVFALMDEMADRIKNDLRFSMAMTYPRVRAVVEIRVEGFAEDADAGFQIQKILAPKDGKPGSTPEDVASARADSICFVVRALRQEVSQDGETELPPDAIRDELGLAKPRKTIVEDGMGRQSFVDVVSPGSDMPALMRG